MAKADPVRIAVTLGFVVTSMVAVVGFWQALTGAREPPRLVAAPAPGVPHIPVEVADVPLPRGGAITAAQLRTIAIEGAGPADGYATPDAVVGHVALTDILPGQIVLPAMISSEPAAAGLAVLIPPGQRAVAVAVAEETAVSNLLRPGDLVDVLLVLRAGVLPRTSTAPPVVPPAFAAAAASAPQAGSDGGDPSETRVLLQAVRVLSVTARTGAGLPTPGGAPPADAAAGGHTLTLALTLEQAQTLALGRTLGTLALALRNPADATRSVVPAVTLPMLRADDAPVPRRAARTDGPRAVELIVGGERRLIYPLLGTAPAAAPVPGGGRR